MSRTLTITLNDAEADTILAALRNFQRMDSEEQDLSMIDDPSCVLAGCEIDELCERFDCHEPASMVGPSPTFG